MPNVELLYLLDCPYVEQARMQLRRALELAGLPPMWREHDLGCADAPERVQGFGSPTVLVDGRDVMGSPAASQAASCRVYDGAQGIPPLAALVAALAARSPQPAIRGTLASSLVVLPGALVSALPVVTCASCWPAYAGAMASLGMPVLLASSSLLPVTAVALAAGVIGLAVRARQRRALAPLILGIAGATLVLAGKFALQIDAAGPIGASLLAGASAWNVWPSRQSENGGTRVRSTPVRSKTDGSDLGGRA